MEILVLITLLIIGLFVFRFLKRASVITGVANNALSTGNKINMAIQIVQQRVGEISTPGLVDSDKQFYIGYLVAVAEQQSIADGWPPAMFQALIEQEAVRISGQDAEHSGKFCEAWTSTQSGIDGRRVGEIDGRKLADSQSSQPYFGGLDGWLNAKV